MTYYVHSIWTMPDIGCYPQLRLEKRQKKRPELRQELEFTSILRSLKMNLSALVEATPFSLPPLRFMD